MDKKITELAQQAKDCFANKNWDALIETCNQWLALDPKNAEAYLKRGLAYANKGEFDNAIANYTKAIELKLDYAEAYNGRGTVYYKKDEFDKAIANYTKAIELNPNYAKAYYNRGSAYDDKGEYDKAIADYTKAIKYNQNYVEAYYNRGLAYGKKGEFDKAIKDFTQAIEYKPDYADAYLNRGLAYGKKDEHDKAIADYNQAIKYKKDYPLAYFNLGSAYFSKGEYDNAIVNFAQSYEKNISGNSRALAYIAHKIKETNLQKPIALFILFISVLITIEKIMRKLHLNPDLSDSENFPVVHYCSIETLKSMTKGGRFRFYNVAYMNDPEEGEAFFRMMGDKDKGIRGYFYGDKDDDKNSNNMPKYQSCYIGSFVANEDRIDFWRTYGKEGGIDAAGCNLIFNKKQFSPDLREGFGRDFKFTDSKNKRPVLFEVYYGKEKNEDKEDKDKDIKKLLDELKAKLEELEIAIEKYPAEHKEELKLLACELIDSVRYLFKSKHYANEQEVRIVEYMIPEYEYMIPEYEIKTDDSGENWMKFYIEPYKDFRFNEITLGPKTKEVVALSVWVDKKLPRVQVKKSTIPYR